MQSTTPPCVRAVLWLAAYNVGELQPERAVIENDRVLERLSNPHHRLAESKLERPLE